MSHLPPLNTETIWAIINDKIDDDTVKKLLWYHLGYRYNPITDTWTNSEVAPTWRDGEFGPRQTRRATSANWLLSYMLITTGKIE
jgi:hypothetical protein